LQNNPNKSQRIALRIKKSPRTAGEGPPVLRQSTRGCGA